MSAALFKKRLSKLIGDRASKCSRFISDEVHSSIICKLEAFSKGEEKPRTSQEYRWVQSMAVVRYGEGARKLIRKGNGLEVLPESRLFEVMHEAHINLARSHLKTNCPLRLGPARRPTCCHMVHPHRLLPTGQGPRWRPLAASGPVRPVRRHPQAPNTDAEGDTPSPFQDTRPGRHPVGHHCGDILLCPSSRKPHTHKSHINTPH